MQYPAYVIGITLKGTSMSISTIQANIAAMLNKAYSTDTGTVSAGSESDQVKSSTTTDAGGSASASAEVSLGQSGNTTEIYTAQGLLQQMRQIQLSNTQFLFSSGDNSDDNTSLFGLSGSADSDDLESMSQDWTQSISQNPGKAAVMVESAKNTSLTTILGN